MGSKKVLTPNFRVSFPHVFTPQADQNGKQKYSLVMLFSKKEDLSKIKTAIKDAVAEKWGAKVPQNLRMPLRDGDAKAKENPELYGSYTGCYFIQASTVQQPGLVDESCEPIIDPREFYAGCYAHATITAYGYDRNGNKGVGIGLQNIQKVNDGDPLSGRSRAEDDFAPLDQIPVTETEGATISDADLGL